MVLRGLELSAVIGQSNWGNLTCFTNQGVVRLAGLRPGPIGKTILSVQQCASVFADDCTFDAQTILVGSTVVFTNCSLSGLMTGFPPTITYPPAITQYGGRTQLVGCQVYGLTTPGLPDAKGIRLNGGEVRTLGGGQIVCGTFSGPAAPAIDGTGTVRLDPSVSVQGGPPLFAPGISVTVQAMPHVTATDSPLFSGGTSTAALHGPNGHLGVLAVGLAGPAFDVPGVFADPLFWAQGMAVTISAGVPATGQPVTGLVTIPANPVFLGLQLLYQGITWEAAAGLQISNPAVGVVR